MESSLGWFAPSGPLLSWVRREAKTNLKALFTRKEGMGVKQEEAWLKTVRSVGEEARIHHRVHWECLVGKTFPKTTAHPNERFSPHRRMSLQRKLLGKRTGYWEDTPLPTPPKNTATSESVKKP